MADFEVNIEALNQFRVGLSNFPFPLAKLETDGNFSSPSGFRTDTPAAVGEISLNGVFLPAATIIPAARKKVVTTAIAGRDHTINEIISFEQWEVTIQGFVIEETAEQGDGAFQVAYRLPEYPLARLREQVQLFRLNEAVAVECEFLNELGIDFMVLTRLRFPPIRGAVQAFAYEIQGVSDQPIELELANV